MNNIYIKSPLNYVGGKYKLLSQIIPIFPDKINTFVDLFGGGFNVGINVNANRIIYNDTCTQVVKLLSYMKGQDIGNLLNEIDKYIAEYHLSKENKDGYLALREDYNLGNKTNMKFYTLLCYAFNYQIRFNSNGDYNMPFGKARSSFNPSLRQKFIDFVYELHKKNISFTNKSFLDFDFTDLDSVDFVYADPPYYNSVASYNENSGWTEDNEIHLLLLLDSLDCMKIKFALSNNLKYDNPLLNEWKEKYNVHYLNGDYSNCNYQKKDKSKGIEVLITNY